MPQESLDLAVVIITLNEEHNLPQCLASLPPNSDIIVVDSGSRDKTTQIASSKGARIFNRSFDDYASQKNYAIAQAKAQWILSIDADEVLDPGLCKALNAICTDANAQTPQAYRLKRRLVFMGKTMRFGQTTDYPVRLFTRGAAQFKGSIHEKLELKDNAKLSCHCGGSILHYSYDNLEEYFEKFNQYTSKIANQRFSGKKHSFGALQLLRPWFEFTVRYFVKLGFLDGYEGYCYALLSSFYKFVNYAKLRELQRKSLPSA